MTTRSKSLLLGFTIYVCCFLHGTQPSPDGSDTCSTSYLGTTSCPFKDKDFCGGVGSGFDCEHLWSVTKSGKGDITGGVKHGGDTDDFYSYLNITDTPGVPCKLESTVFMPSVKAVCIEFKFATTGAGEHGINVGFEYEQGQEQIDLFSVPPSNTGGEWSKVGASCCLREGDRERNITYGVTNATVDSTVAIDELEVRVANRTCREDDPPCTVYTLDVPPVEIVEPVDPVKTVEPLDLVEAGKPHPKQSDHHCTDSHLGTSACTFTNGFCGGVHNGIECEQYWVEAKGETGQVSSEESTDNVYTYLEITEKPGAPCKLESKVFMASVKAVCIEFKFATTGAGEHGINVGFEYEQGQEQIDLFSVPPSNTGGEWSKVGASCCLRGDDLERYVNFDVTGATANSTVAIDELNVRVSSRTCGPNDPPCLVYEDHGVAGQNNQSQTDVIKISDGQETGTDIRNSNSSQSDVETAASFSSHQQIGLAVTGCILVIMVVAIVAGTLRVTKTLARKHGTKEPWSLPDFDVLAKPERSPSKCSDISASQTSVKLPDNIDLTIQTSNRESASSC